tara:strand:+ start:204 stop:446 length:243 start_codon:yes stop_codon:yes gene_type:complete
MFARSSHLDYTVKLAKTLTGVILVAWREPKKRYQLIGQSNVPYHLASYLQLMPSIDGPFFTHKLYSFDHNDLDTLEECEG